MKKVFPALLLLGAGLGLLPAQDKGAPQQLPQIELHIGKAKLETQIASTERERELGLMFVVKMHDNDGMLFLMPRVGPANFWMKDTLIPLSIAYIDRRGVIIDLHDMKALDETPIPSLNDQVAYALETNLHWFSLNGIKAGDTIAPPPSAWGKPQP